MVMATGSVCQQFGTGDMSHQAAEGAEVRDTAAALHERLVAFVHALAPPYEARSGVWVEHSYARARGAPHPPSSNVRVLLAPPPEPTDAPEEIDVEREDPPAPSPPEPRRSNHAHSPSDTDDDLTEEDWEPRVLAIAPTAAHATLAETALEILRRLRLARLADRAGAREHERLAARKLRHALALAASAPGPQAQRPGPWLHATLLAYMPRYVRRLYDILTAELRRAAPKLAERMMGARAPPPRREPLAGVGPPVGPDAPVWLVWLGSGSDHQDRRWRRRLSALVHTRLLPVPSVGTAKPDVWCAAVAAGMKAALTDTITEAGDRPVIVGGAGMGATLCVALASGLQGPAAVGPAGVGPAGAGPGGVRGLLLLGLPLLTAEGPRDAPDDPINEIKLPMLLVCGTNGSGTSRVVARAICRPRDGARCRRLLEVRGADELLRASALVRRRRRLPQHALDAAIADECARWVIEMAERPPDASPPRSPPRAPRRRTELRAAPPVTPAPPPIVTEEDDEYAHLPSATISTRLERPTEISGSPHGMCLSEGRVVSRGSGSTPLALMPPRRVTAAPAPPTTPLAAADIMQLPIVFADDEGIPSSTHYPVTEDTPDTPVTVTSGDSAAGVTWRANPYSRVIVASRGGSARGVSARGVSARGVRGGIITRGGTRPLLLRRRVRMVNNGTNEPH